MLNFQNLKNPGASCERNLALGLLIVANNGILRENVGPCEGTPRRKLEFGKVWRKYQRPGHVRKKYQR
ncbi:unnamed protein product [Allacma fusca]|uniref:Uncharacterized protein n=1 Tax=Allacma fusca TaxID=39272 RepID=A0A8J2PSS3_9HEXA|nr:unnamed protein product [Allacma fusca]